MEAKGLRRSVPARDGNPKPDVSKHATLPRAGKSHPKKFLNPEKIALHTKPSYPPPVFPKHCVLPRDGSLLEKSSQFAGKVPLLEDEYQRMLEFVRDNVKKQVKVARLKENVPHNRYLDIVPFDDNYVQLKSDVFKSPKVSYVNASRISFLRCDQTFLATQAPKPESVAHFWHMVIQEQVSVIVMITKLVEKNKRKAHQYWPESSAEDPERQKLDIGGGCKVEHLSTSFQGSYYQRKFLLHLPDSGRREIVQLHTNDWPDLSAPEQPRVLLDLVHRTYNLQNCPNKERPGTILVHCSAGVGRTGTFLAVYKLWLDYLNPNVTNFSILPLVVSLRRQRCLMVQKKEQYVYIARCFSFFVSSEEGDLYEATGEDADLQDN